MYEKMSRNFRVGRHSKQRSLHRDHNELTRDLFTALFHILIRVIIMASLRTIDISLRKVRFTYWICGHHLKFAEDNKTLFMESLKED